jgi:hypothetical protein
MEEGMTAFSISSEGIRDIIAGTEDGNSLYKLNA